MDRISAPESLADRVLEGKRSRRTRPALAVGVLAACCLVAAVGGWQLWQGRSLAGPDPTAGVAATPQMSQQVIQEGDHTLVVEDAFGGQPHSFPNVPGYAYPDCTGSDAVVGDYAYPEGWFLELLSAQEIIAVLGGTDAVPWTLDWTGFGLDGTVIYDGEGQPWLIDIMGQRGEDTLRLELWPGREPIIDLIYADAAVQAVDGVDVTTYSLYYDRDGDDTKEYTYHADYFDGAMGVSFTCTSKDQSAAARLASLVVGHKGFTAEGLDAPKGGNHTADLGTARLYGSGKLTLAQAYQQELAAYLPDRSALPDGFTFESAHWHFDEVEDSLSILWCRGYDTVSVKAALLLDSNTGEQLDTDVLPDEITPQAMEQRFGRYVDDDLGDTPGWRYESFTVHYFRNGEPTVAVTYSIKGLTPEEAAALVNSCQGEWSLD